MEPFERMWIENYIDLAADARALGDDEMYQQAMENARHIYSQTEDAHNQARSSSECSPHIMTEVSRIPGAHRDGVQLPDIITKKCDNCEYTEER